MTERSDLPLLRWGETLRQARIVRRTRRRRLAIGAAGIALLGLTVAFPPVPRLVWNASQSAPMGLYYLHSGRAPEPGNMVVAWPPAAMRQLAAIRHYLPLHVPLVKRVAATSGDTVCAVRQAIFINGHWVAERRQADGQGRPMPSWRGCVTLRGGAVLLLMDDPASFDTGVANGFAAGDVSTPDKRRLDNAGVSANAAGVDCSGFVSRCLKLPSVFDTAQLQSICTVLPSASDLRPGDILNIPRRHVLLCAGWVDADRKWIYYYETGGAPDYWKPGLKEAPLASLVELGYKPLRYRGMAREPGLSGKEVLTRGIRAKSAVVTEPVIGEP